MNRNQKSNEDWIRDFREGRIDFQLLGDQLVKNNKGLVAQIARRNAYWGEKAGLDFEDLVQEGYERLLRVERKFDLSKGFKFSTFAFPWIDRGIRRAIENAQKSCPANVTFISLDQPQNDDGDAQPMTLVDESPTPEENVLAQERPPLQDLLAQLLSPEELDLLVLHSVHEVPWCDIATLTGKTVHAVRNKCHRSRQSLRENQELLQWANVA